MRVYIDGRSDFYGEKFGLDYIDLMNVKYDWQNTLSKRGVDTVLLATTSPLASTIKESSRWRVVYDDGTAIVFRLASFAAGTGERTSTNKTGGGGSGLQVTYPTTVILQDR